MTLNLNQIRHITRIKDMLMRCLIFLFVVFFSNISFAQIKNEDELKKVAEKHFEEEEYADAYKLYSQLVSLYPKDPEYNYRLGVCMLYTEPDKKKPYSYLQLASKSTDAPKDVKFYLAKTYHINYKFDEAIKLYEEYKKTASSSSVKKLQVDREIEACRNGKRLLSNLSDLVIINKKQLNEADYFRSYELKSIGGKLLVKPDDFKSGTDKKKKEKSVIYLPKTGERVYYSSYGDGGDKGRDIYFANKLPNGTWSKPTLMPASINTEYDEDYPFLHPNGKTLYFSSKGHNSMGGYDIFKTTFDEQTNTWSKPVNLEFPINSPDDDILFVTDSLEKTAYFSTGRYSPYGKIDVLKINTERRPMNFAVIKGTTIKETPEQSLKSKITVKNMENGEIVGSFEAGEKGDYNMELPNGGKFIFTVETPGLPTQSDAVQVPVAYTLKPYKQVISYDNKVLKIINYFDGQVADDNYSMMIDLIEKKAKLEINEMEPYNNGLKDAAIKNNDNANVNNGNNLNAVSSTNPTVSSSNENKNQNSGKNITNDELLSIAKQDVKEAEIEASKLKQDAQDAFSLATQKTDEANQKQKEADEAITKANAITDVNQKNEELAKANSLKEEANIAKNVANTATNLAKKLEVDANQKQKEADLTNQYIKEIEAVTKNKNNKEALAKLEQIQKQLDELNSQKNQSDELVNSLKAEADLKQNELQKSEKKSNDIANEINAIKNETKTLENDLANESDKSLKENISAQIRELNNDVELKNKELEANNQKINNLKNEVESINKEIEIANKILSNDNIGIASNNENGKNNQPANNVTNNINNPSSDNTNIETSKSLTSKYSAQVNSSEGNSKEDLEKQNSILNNYNNDVVSAINANKSKLSGAKNPNEKTTINNEIKELEKIKSDNDKLLAANTNKLKTIDNNALANNNNNINANNASVDNTNIETSASLTNKYSTQLNSCKGNTKEDLEKQNSIINNYNTDLVSAININKSKLTNTQNPNEKTAINNEIKELEKIKSDNDKLLAANNTKLKAIENSTIANNNITNANNVSENNNANNNANNNVVNNNSNSNASAFEGAKESITPIAINNPNDKTAIKNELGNLNNNINSIEAKENSTFAFNEYKDPTSASLKADADKKIEIAKQKQNELKNLIAQTQNNLNSESTNINPTTLVNEAENLNNTAYEKRKEAASKSGAEKDAIIKEAVELEKNAVSKKLQASTVTETQNKAQFENNNTNLTELQKLSANKTGNEISQANLLADEAAINFKQAQKMRDEANAYPTDAAKLGGLSNAEEKENEALFKQQKAIELLAKNNPGYKVKTLDETTNANQNIVALNNEITKTNQAQLDAYLALSKANQNELKTQNDIISKNPNLKNPANKEALSLKTKADNLTKEAKNLIGQSLVAKSPAEKANLLLKANEKEIEALSSINQASNLLANPIAVNNNANNPNNENNVSENKTDVNPVNTNTVNSTVVSETNNPNANNVAVNTNTTSVSNNNIDNKNNNTDNDNLSARTNTTVSNSDISNNNITSVSSNTTNPEKAVTNFNEYSSTEAANIKEQALAKINAAQKAETNSNASNSGTSTSMSLTEATQTVGSTVTESETFSNQAFALRKEAATKSGTEKEQLISQAKELESKSIAKKVEAAKQQEQINNAVYEANKQNLEELAKMAKGKNISELNNAEQQYNEANAQFTQAQNLRTEANNLPNDAAKIGGYSNAEEKENQALAKQKELLDVYQKYFSNYVLKEPNIVLGGNQPKASESNDAATQQYNEGLTLLAQANQKEYQARFTNLPGNLNENQTALKNQAQQAYNNQQTLLAKADNTSDLKEKKNTLLEANQNGQKAIDLLNQINKTTPVANNKNNIANNNDINKNNNANNNVASNSNNQPNNVTPPRNNTNNVRNTTTNTAAVKVDGLEVKTTNAYSANNPIPIDEKIPDGLVFKVQIGAFKTPLPNNTFKGLSPIIGQTTPSGYIRYMAGNFNKYESANAVKNDLRSLGYNDAFVVVYFNGKRITMAEALEKLKESGQPVDLASANNASAGLTRNANIPKNNITPANPADAVNITLVNNTVNAAENSQPVEVAKELEQMNGLLYTVQIGVFSKQTTKAQLFNLKPIYTEKLPNGLYRYTAGIYNQPSKLLEDKRKVVDLGVKDAFVSAYYNSKRIPFAEGQKIQADNNNLKMETENPIVFPGSNSNITNQPSVTAVNSASVTNEPVITLVSESVQPFSNGVTKGPEPTADNGVKTDDAGISYKVQIGAYKNQVPNDVASKFMSIKTWPVNNKQVNGLYIYTIGNFNSSSFAKKLRDEAVSLGITDAFITVYKDGKKLYGAEANEYLSK